MTRADLEEERSFLLRSLEDLEREHSAGDLTDEDHAALRAQYVARTAAVLRSLDAGAEQGAGGPGPVDTRPVATAPETSPPPARRRRRRLLVVGAVVAVVAAAVATVLAVVGPRLPGETVTGSVPLTESQKAARTLAQAETDEGRGDALDAIKLYQAVLSEEPRQEVALAEVGWLEYEAGVEARRATLLSLGESQEQQAESVAPGAAAPHLYLGSMLLAQGDAAGAVAQFRLFLAAHPPRATVRAAVPFITKAYAEIHETPPPLPVGSG